MKTNEYISLITSLIAVICSLIALFHVCPRVLGLDYLGIIVGILSLLITLLLGWNIYTLVDFKRKMNELNDIKKDFRKIFDVNRATYIAHIADIEESIAIIYGLKLEQYKETNAETEWISHLIYSALHYAKTGNKKKGNLLIHEAIEAIKHVDGQKLDKRKCFLLSHYLENHKNLGLNEVELLIHNILLLH